MSFNVPYNNYKINDAIKRDEKCKINCKTKTKTHQSFKDECDINNIIRKYSSTGLITHVNEAQAVYADLTNMPSAQEAFEQMILAQDAFYSLPSKIRKRFHHNAAEFLDFVGNPDNLPEMVSLGLATVQPAAPSGAHDAGVGAAEAEQKGA